MAKYKLFINPMTGKEESITHYIDSHHRQSISISTDNTEFNQFVHDIYTQGLGIVEGADYVGVVSYTDARREEYPSIADQLDKIYHSGVDAWKADIKEIKDKYPKTQVGVTSVAPLPDWVHTVLFDKQKEEYMKAEKRLAQYELSEGIKNEDGTYAIEPLPLYVEEVGRNPLIVLDETERAIAQDIINKTPQAVKDSVSS
tara:strand:- start:114 stop:713 length:600 start_codon:yes stop_codon:yes gene_type:complete